MNAQTIYDRRPPAPPEVSFLVPVFNERKSAASVLKRLGDLPIAKEMIVVDDGSTDGTRELLSQNPVEGALLIFHAANRGKGAALQTALERARGAYAAIQDADLEYDPADNARLLDTLRTRKVSVVFGSRLLKDNPVFYRRCLLGNKLLTALTNLICHSRFTDVYTGSKLMAAETLRSLGLKSNGFEVEAEIAVKVALRGLPYAECPVGYAPRKWEEGKKIGWRDAVKGTAAIFRLWWKERFKLNFPLGA